MIPKIQDIAIFAAKFQNFSKSDKENTGNLQIGFELGPWICHPKNMSCITFCIFLYVLVRYIRATQVIVHR